MIRLGINIDHVATIRNARGEAYPDPVQIAAFCELGGADNITCHLREDRRHIRDRDVYALKDAIKVPLNFEMGATDEMVGIALKLHPHAVTLVPERRQELTTEGGLDVMGLRKSLKPTIEKLQAAGIVVSLFIEGNTAAIRASKELGVEAIEIHTGGFCHALDKATTTRAKYEVVKPFVGAAELAHSLGLQVHVGHGLNYQNAHWLQLIPHVEEANIGHSVIARALFVGMEKAVFGMKELINSPNAKPFLPSDL